MGAFKKPQQILCSMFSRKKEGRKKKGKKKRSSLTVNSRASRELELLVIEEWNSHMIKMEHLNWTLVCNFDLSNSRNSSTGRVAEYNSEKLNETSGYDKKHEVKKKKIDG